MILRGPPEEEDQGTTASTFSLSDVSIEVAKEESECKRVSSTIRLEISESRLGT